MRLGGRWRIERNGKMFGGNREEKDSVSSTDQKNSCECAATITWVFFVCLKLNIVLQREGLDWPN